MRRVAGLFATNDRSMLEPKRLDAGPGLPVSYSRVARRYGAVNRLCEVKRPCLHKQWMHATQFRGPLVAP